MAGAGRTSLRAKSIRTTRGRRNVTKFALLSTLLLGVLSSIVAITTSSSFFLVSAASSAAVHGTTARTTALVRATNSISRKNGGTSSRRRFFFGGGAASRLQNRYWCGTIGISSSPFFGKGAFLPPPFRSSSIVSGTAFVFSSLQHHKPERLSSSWSLEFSGTSKFNAGNNFGRIMAPRRSSSRRIVVAAPEHQQEAARMMSSRKAAEAAASDDDEVDENGKNAGTANAATKKKTKRSPSSSSSKGGTGRRRKQSDGDATDEESIENAGSTTAAAKKGRTPAAVRTKKKKSDEERQEGGAKKTSPAVASKGKKKVVPDGGDSSGSEGGGDDDEPPKKKAKKPKKAPAHQVLTERDELPKLWTEQQAQQNGSYTFKVASWNVAGLRALLKKTPDVLKDLVEKHNLDVLCLQETKLQEQHLDDPKLIVGGSKTGATIRTLLDDVGYDAHYSCSTAKKGYAGTAVYIRRRHGVATSSSSGSSGKKQKTIDKFFFANKSDGDKNKKQTTDAGTDSSLPIDPNLLIPESVSYGMGIDKHDAEGRIIVMDFPIFTMCNVYVPNSGQNLDRLTYRTEEWDKDWVDFIRRKGEERNVPAMWIGDLNVAHTNLEVWNDGAKHLPKQAGVTPQERASFQQQLDSGFVDTFRRLHPEAKGHYSYWSQRAGNRTPNKGLRLDYFVGDPSFFDDGETGKVIARDCYMDFDQEGSDHCPVLLELEIRK